MKTCVRSLRSAYDCRFDRCVAEKLERTGTQFPAGAAQLVWCNYYWLPFFAACATCAQEDSSGRLALRLALERPDLGEELLDLFFEVCSLHSMTNDFFQPAHSQTFVFVTPVRVRFVAPQSNNRPDVLLPFFNEAILACDWDRVFLFLKVCPEVRVLQNVFESGDSVVAEDLLLACILVTVFSYFFIADQQVLQEKDAEGRLPLHILSGETDSKLDVCGMFLTIFPDACRKRNPLDDRLPLHQLAARNNWHTGDE